MTAPPESHRRNRHLALALFWAGLFALSAPQALAADPVGDAVVALENRFFFRQYGVDPLEKRIQRLELLVFGGTREGSNSERTARLKEAIAARDRQAAEALSARAGGGKSPSAGPDGKPSSSSQYPVLNTLEWRVLKKTFPQDSLDQRLDRLEGKLFGVPSQAMSYADRIERLKRTVGIDIARTPAPPAGPRGPLPKARPRGQDGGGEDWKQQPWTYGSPLLPDYMPPGTFRTPSPQDMPPGAFRMPVPQGMPPGFAEMFQELNRQMEQLMKMPPGNYELDPDSGIFIVPDGGGRTPFGERGRLPGRQRLPSPPAYNDPNSI